MARVCLISLTDVYLLCFRSSAGLGFGRRGRRRQQHDVLGHETPRRPRPPAPSPWRNQQQLLAALGHRQHVRIGKCEPTTNWLSRRSRTVSDWYCLANCLRKLPRLDAEMSRDRFGAFYFAECACNYHGERWTIRVNLFIRAQHRQTNSDEKT